MLCKTATVVICSTLIYVCTCTPCSKENHDDEKHKKRQTTTAVFNNQPAETYRMNAGRQADDVKHEKGQETGLERDRRGTTDRE